MASAAEAHLPLTRALLPVIIYFGTYSDSTKLMAASSDEKVPEINVEGSNPEEKDAPNDDSNAAASAPVQAGRRRQKVPLAPGHTLGHWNALVMTRKRFTPSVKITPKELAQHRSQTDAWVSLNGKVFDVTKYLDYHPGGMCQ